MKHLFIVNPTAGDKDSTPHVRQMVEAAFKNRDDNYEVYVTKAPMDAVDKIKADAVSGEHIRVYACGGDGTFNECVCGAALLPNVAVCPFPTGTGNDFCRMFGTEADMFRDLEALLQGEEHEIDLIDCNGRWCANICSVGIDARIGNDVHKYSKLPIIGGAAGYVVSTIVNLFKGINRRMRVKAGNFAAEGDHALVCACNGRFYGGGYQGAPTAVVDDGMLDFVLVKKISRFQIPFVLGKYKAGTHEGVQCIETIRGKEMRVKAAKSMVCNIDGECFTTDAIQFRLIANAYRFVLPTSVAARRAKTEKVGV